MLATTWRKRKPFALLVGIQNDADMMKTVRWLLKNTENRTTLWPSNSASGYIPTGIKIRDSNIFVLKSLLQHHSWKASILQCSALFMVQLSHLYMTTGKTIALTRWTFVGKVISLLFNMLSKLVITFLPRSKHLLISWLQSPSAVKWSPRK